MADFIVNMFYLLWFLAGMLSGHVAMAAMSE